PTSLERRASRLVLRSLVPHHHPPGPRFARGSSSARHPPPPSRAAPRRNGGRVSSKIPPRLHPGPTFRVRAEPSRTSECATSTAGHPLGGNRRSESNFPKKPGGLTHGYPRGV